MDNASLAIHLFLQIAVILLACRVVGAVAARLGQPQVVAEMIAGVLLGPSLFGLLAPGPQAWLFPWDPTQQARDTSAYLFPLSQLGLAVYMFLVGLEFRADIVRRHWRSSLAISLAGLVAPFALGGGLALLLWQHPEIFPEQTSRNEAVLFLGAAMCVTAFPMLARIIHFKKLGGTPMGSVSIGAGALDDVAAWLMLAVVLASFDGELSRSLRNFAGAGAFVAISYGILRPLLKRYQRCFLGRDGRLGEGGLLVALALMALGSWWTDSIHLHAVFGSFVVGAVMPRGVVARDLVAKIEPLALGLLLPLFFAYSGLNTRIGLLDSWFLWGVCAAVVAVAVLGKWGGCAVAARLTGFPAREATGIGLLMNARGLMELIIINIGLERGIITEGLFATLVVMAVVTTLMTSPLFERLCARHAAVPEAT